MRSISSSEIAAATALHQQVAQAADEKSGPEVVRGEKTITLNVNGQDRSVKVEPRTTLLDALRYQLDLTGAKPICTDGSSGCCSRSLTCASRATAWGS